jgi:hypothetical protein
MLHLVPTLQSLDSIPCYPHRSALPTTFNGRASSSSSNSNNNSGNSGNSLNPRADSLSSSSSSYTSIHLPPHRSVAQKHATDRRRPRYAKETQAELMRRGFSGPRTPAPESSSALHGEAAAAAAAEGQDQHSHSPPPQPLQPPPSSSYVPPWRRLPNPLPHGWRDYAGLASQSLVER